MLTPAALKRRKLNDTSSKLLKPFVSPLRTRRPTPTSSEPPIDEAISNPQPYLPSTAAHTIKSEQPGDAIAFQHKKTHVGSTPVRKPAPSTPQSNPICPAEAAAQKEIRAFQQQIRHIQADIDTLKQARQISQSGDDAHLTGLAEKWRLACQSVADELFIDAKQRVDDMGGVAAWKKNESHSFRGAEGVGGFAWDEIVKPGDDADCEFDSQGEELPEKEQQYRREMKEMAKQQMMETADPTVCAPRDIENPHEESDEDHGNTFTMGMMLRSLHIDPDVLGYDQESEGWIS